MVDCVTILNEDTSCKQVLYRRPLDDKTATSDDENLEQSCIVIDERLNDARRLNVAKASFAEYNRHLAA